MYGTTNTSLHLYIVCNTPGLTHIREDCLLSGEYQSDVFDVEQKVQHTMFLDDENMKIWLKIMMISQKYRYELYKLKNLLFFLTTLLLKI